MVPVNDSKGKCRIVHSVAWQGVPVVIAEVFAWNVQIDPLLTRETEFDDLFHDNHSLPKFA